MIYQCDILGERMACVRNFHNRLSDKELWNNKIPAIFNNDIHWGVGYRRDLGSNGWIGFIQLRLILRNQRFHLVSVSSAGFESSPRLDFLRLRRPALIMR